ncbi:secreted frizzled-related protein 2 isoform X2 [Lampris incognitus]|uniref:secreted frizzled-related protein 2 isoform X2 n=1 Tax=Lampris incognitus TaxID=2546036 RepID=UPI0024B58FCD|nr:secreted frizzled-related protein 2 isoform X2 [Lampris incognitus]
MILLPHPHLKRRSHSSVPLLLLLLFAGPGGTSVLGPSASRVRTEAEPRTRSGVKAREGDQVKVKADGEYIHEDTGVLRPGTPVGEERGVWGEPSADFGPVLPSAGAGQWEPRISSRCMPVPSGMALCQGIGYNTMRIPNLLGHETPTEAVQQSASWLPLLARECHPDARIFLCSLFAPICLDRFVSPCRSLCESVRDSCAPIMGCYGYPWPQILRCDQFPADHLLCISSITNTSVTTGGRRVVKLRLTRLKFSPISLAQFSLASKLEVLKHGPLLGGQIRSRIELWLERDATCVRNMTRHQPQGGTFLVTGTVQGDRLVVNKVFAWQRRDKHLMAAARKWKRHQCRS